MTVKPSPDRAPTYVIGGTRDVSAWKEAEPAGWVEEEACDKAKGQAADATQVKGQEWDGLLYRHWDHWTGRDAEPCSGGVGGQEWSAGPDASECGGGCGDADILAAGGPLGYAWAPDSKEIAYVANLDPVPAASTNNDVFTLRLDEAGAKAVKVSTSAGGRSMGRLIRRMASGWRSGRRRAAGFESDKFRLMVFDRITKKTVSGADHEGLLVAGSTQSST